MVVGYEMKVMLEVTTCYMFQMMNIEWHAIVFTVCIGSDLRPWPFLVVGFYNVAGHGDSKFNP